MPYSFPLPRPDVPRFPVAQAFSTTLLHSSQFLRCSRSFSLNSTLPSAAPKSLEGSMCLIGWPQTVAHENQCGLRWIAATLAIDLWSSRDRFSFFAGNNRPSRKKWGGPNCCTENQTCRDRFSVFRFSNYSLRVDSRQSIYGTQTTSAARTLVGIARSGRDVEAAASIVPRA